MSCTVWRNHRTWAQTFPFSLCTGLGLMAFRLFRSTRTALRFVQRSDSQSPLTGISSHSRPLPQQTDNSGSILGSIMAEKQERFVFQRDGQVVDYSTSAKAFLASASSGSYTTMRTIHQDRVVELQAHLDRMANTARLMISEKANKEDRDRLLSELHKVVKGEEASALLKPQIKIALDEFRREHVEMNREYRITLHVDFPLSLADLDPVRIHVCVCVLSCVVMYSCCGVAPHPHRSPSFICFLTFTVSFIPLHHRLIRIPFRSS